MSNDIQWTNNHLAFRSRKLIWLSALLIVSIIGWASWATLEEVVIGEGKVVPSPFCTNHSELRRRSSSRDHGATRSISGERTALG